MGQLANNYRGELSERASSSMKTVNSIRTTLGNIATRCSPGYGVRLWRMPCAARKTISSRALVSHRARLRLDAVGVEHVAHARADDPGQLLGLGVHSTA
jgi:hypothetical protein